MNLTHQKKSKVIRSRRQGFKLWRIALDHKLSVQDVARILVDAGIIHLDLVEATITRETKE